jgi:hypothetical protein
MKGFSEFDPHQPTLIDVDGYTAPFVLQRHKAKRWHFDLRFKFGKSKLVDFALPELGPSSTPGTVVEAVRIDDHKLNALTKEGIGIGEDGSPVGMTISDKGGVRPTIGSGGSVDDQIRLGLREGCLPLTFEGRWMKGCWLLEGVGREWTLLKLDDAYANYFTFINIVRSIVTGKTIEELWAEYFKGYL